MPTKQRIKLIAQGGLVVDLPMIADVDLSASGQYRFVTPASTVGNVKLSTGGSNPTPLGVLQNAPVAGQPARVRIFGISSMNASPGACNIALGSFITSSSTGTACLATCTGAGTALGRWLSASTAADITNGTGCAFINCAAFGAACPGATT